MGRNTRTASQVQPARTVDLDTANGHRLDGSHVDDVPPSRRTRFSNTRLSRTLALAVRLFGNMMSGTMILGILLAITPLIFPVAMSALGLLTGMVQAYIFGILATVYLAAAIGSRG